MKDRRQRARRRRHDRRWSEDRRTENMLRLYAAAQEAATLFSSSESSYRPDQLFTDGVAAPDRRRGPDRRVRRRRRGEDRRQLDDPAFVVLTAAPAEPTGAPATWRVDDFTGLRRAIEADVTDLAELRPPESWSRDRDLLYRTVRGWSHTVVRRTRAIVLLLEEPDIVTALSLMCGLKARVEDLCLLRSYEHHERTEAAVHALLYQALAQTHRWPLRHRSVVLDGAIKELRARIDRRAFARLAELATDPTNHWSGLGRKERARRAGVVTESRLADQGLRLQSDTDVDLVELDVVDIAPNVKDYRPRQPGADSRRTVVALQVWDWLYAARSAARGLLSA